MIHATHCGGAHRVITHSTLVGSGSAISNCRRLPALHGAPCHCTFEPWISENPGQRLQLENTFQATSHWALVKIVWLMRVESDCDFGTGTCRERSFSGLDGLHIVVERPFLKFRIGRRWENSFAPPWGRSNPHPQFLEVQFALENLGGRAYTETLTSLR